MKLIMLDLLIISCKALVVTVGIVLAFAGGATILCGMFPDVANHEANQPEDTDND